MPDFADAVRRVGIPCVVRPEDSTHRIKDEKALFIESEADLRALEEALRGVNEPLVIQRMARGLRHNLYFAASHGKLIGLCEARIDRTDRTDGSGLAVEGTTLAPNADLVRWTGILTELMDYTGIGCAQFLVDAESSKFMFLEINPRVPGNHAIAERAGLPLAKLAIDLALDRVAPGPVIVGRAGMRFAWNYGDMRGLREAIRKERLPIGKSLKWLARIGSMALMADMHITWSRSDPMPTLALFARQVGLDLPKRTGPVKVARPAATPAASDALARGPLDAQLHR